jgi:hypothetical protein
MVLTNAIRCQITSILELRPLVSLALSVSAMQHKITLKRNLALFRELTRTLSGD